MWLSLKTIPLKIQRSLDIKNCCDLKVVHQRLATVKLLEKDIAFKDLCPKFRLIDPSVLVESIYLVTSNNYL